MTVSMTTALVIVLTIAVTIETVETMATDPCTNSQSVALRQL